MRPKMLLTSTEGRQSNAEYLVFVGRVERNLAALFVGGATLGDLANRQLHALEKSRLRRVAVAFSVHQHTSTQWRIYRADSNTALGVT